MHMPIFYILGTDFKDFQKCLLCPKTFVNESFLISHLNRRHKTEIHSNRITSKILNNYLSSPNNTDTNQLNENNNDEIKSILRDIQSKLQCQQRHGEGTDELVSSLVSAQQRQINELKSLVSEKTNTTDENEGKLRSQELFWQAKVKTIEENVQEAILSSDKKLQKIQEEFENEVSKLKKQRRKDKRNANKKKHTVHVSEENKNDEPDNFKKENVSSQFDKTIENAKVEKGIQAQTTNSSKRASMVLNKVEEAEGECITDDKKTEEGQLINSAVSTTSIKSDHLYEAPLSFHASRESVLEIIEKNPSKIDELRQQSKEKLADQLESLGVNPNNTRLSPEKLNICSKQLKENRKRSHNSSKLIKLRDQYKEEVESLAFQSSLKHGSIKARLSKGMSSFRKQIFSSLQNLNVESSKGSPNTSTSTPTINQIKRRSPKKNAAPLPPKMSQATKEIAVDNKYTPNPTRPIPKPAPRQSKTLIVQPDEHKSESEDDNTDQEYSSDEEEDNEEVQDLDVIGQLVDQEEDIIGKLVDKEKEFDASGNDSEEDESISDIDIDLQNHRKSISMNKNKNGNDRSSDRNITDKNNDEDDVTVVDDNDSVWDSYDEEEDEDKERENGNDLEEPEEIKLRKPTPGSKIADLTNIIEQQLHRRGSLKPAGGVDPLTAAMETIEGEEEGMARHFSMTDLSSNTLGTSQWQENGSYHSRPGSAATLGSFTGYSSRPQSAHRETIRPGPVAPPRKRRTSWDSD